MYSLIYKYLNLVSLIFLNIPSQMFKQKLAVMNRVNKNKILVDRVRVKEHLVLSISS